jgi:hypothetical protein
MPLDSSLLNLSLPPLLVVMVMVVVELSFTAVMAVDGAPELRENTTRLVYNTPS